MRISDWSSDVCSSDLSAEEEVRMCSERCRLRGSTVSWRGDIVPPPEAKSPPSQRPTSTKGQYPRYRRHRLRALDWAFCNTGSRTWLQPQSARQRRSEEHTSELQSLMRISYAVLRLKKT